MKINDKYEMLTVIGMADLYIVPSNGTKRIRVRVICECGTAKIVHLDNLKAGRTKSCGCLRHHPSKNRTHGMTGTKIYGIWQKMWYRCTNSNYHHYKDYGGRGIKVCEEWKKFEQFYKDMGDPPNGLTLERKKNNEGYSASNCTWATPSEQGDNRRSTVLLSYNDVTQSISRWAKERGMKNHTLANRIRLGWSVERR